MAKQTAPRVTRKTKKIEMLALEAVNYYIILAGVAVILLGYVALSMGPWDGFVPLVVAPILLVVGYVVVLPIGIVYRKKTRPASSDNDSIQTA
jgi:hypothetical protein